MSRPHSHWPTSRLAAAGLIALSLATVASCGDDAAATKEISADTFCSDFMQQAPPERITAAGRVATEIGVRNPTDPEWVSALEGRCAAAPDLKLGDFFHHFT